MTLYEFTEAERAYFTEMRALAKDDQGREVLVGLTHEETAEYLNHSRAFLSGRRNLDTRARYLQLHAKHEAARLEVIGSEAHLRNENPPRH